MPLFVTGGSPVVWPGGTPTPPPPNAHIGPAGAMVPVRVPPTPVEVARAGTVFTPIHGRPMVTRSPSAARSWSWSRQWLTDAEYQVLLRLEQGVHGPGPYWFYDPVVAVSNMLTPEVALPGYRGASRVTGLVAAGPVVFADGTRLGYSGEGVGFEAPPVPVLPGKAYAFLGYATGGYSSPGVPAQVTVSLSWLNAAGVVISSDSSVTAVVDSSASDLARLEVTGVAPAGAALVRVSGASDVGGSSLWSGFTLVEGATVPTFWRPGEGMPRVEIVGGLSTTYQAVSAAGARRDAAFTLVEVQ